MLIFPGWERDARIFNSLFLCDPQAIGNMGKVIEDANPNVKQSLKMCIRSNVASPAVQKAAIQALRKMSITAEVNIMYCMFPALP